MDVRIFRSVTPVMIILMYLGMTISCNRQSSETQTAIAVFVPGVLAGSPTYEMMDAGVRKSAAAADADVKTIEGGFDQASWSKQIMALAATGQYDLIVTSNAAMSEICAMAAESYSDQDFLVLDGSNLGGPNVTEVIYNHMEQAFLIGYFAGLVTTSDELKGANSALSVGLIVGQEYPQMTKQIIPGFEIGLHAVNPDIKMEFRVLGNWYDAQKAHELARGLMALDVDVILTIAGGANEGVVAAAREEGTYVLWFDSDGTDIAPGTVLASATLAQDRAAEEWTEAWLNEELEKGKSLKVGVEEGYVNLPLDTRNILRHVPEDILSKVSGILEQMKNGDLKF